MKDGSWETRDLMVLCGSVAAVLCVLVLAFARGCEYKNMKDKAAIERGYVGDGWNWYAPGNPASTTQK